jgi:predicted Zn-dependent protease
MTDAPFRPFETQLDEKTALSVLRAALSGAEDGELYLERKRSEAIVLDDGRIKTASYDASEGFGLRAVKGEVAGYAHSTEISERALIREYMAHIERNLTQLSEQTHAHAVKVAQVPENIKGYGHVKERNIRAARSLWASLDQP